MAWEVFATTCQDGDCAKFARNSETGWVRVRGIDPDDPAQERDVLISPEDWTTLIAQPLR